MRGFLLGSLALIGLQVLLTSQAANAAAGASNVLVAGIRRALSPEVAGVPNRATGPATTAEPPAAPSQGGPGIPIPGI